MKENDANNENDKSIEENKAPEMINMSVNTTFSLLFNFLKGYLTTVGVITYVEAKCIITWGNRTKKRKKWKYTVVQIYIKYERR